MHQTYHNKRVIWESKRKQIGLVLQASVFVAIAFVLKRSYPPYVFWIITIFFGSIGLMILIRLLHPRNLFVTPGSQLGEKILAGQSRQAQEDLAFLLTIKSDSFSNRMKARLIITGQT